MIVLAGVVVALAVVIGGRRRRSAARRLRMPDRSTSPTRERRRIRALFAVAAIGVAIGFAVGGVKFAAVTAAAAVVVARRLRRAEPRWSDIDLALLSDVLASCFGAGANMPAALSAASEAVTGELAMMVRVVADAMRSGATPDQAWAPWLADPSLTVIARVCVRGAGTGAGVAAELTRAATRLRAHCRSAAQHRVRRASVWIVLPLGLCFLPAFVLIGVVPIVAGLVPALH